ncbi:MAG TPA: peptidoglycan-binding protein [Candidatus Paceibacterota bacterium]|nr:peptidoglycan-binding protein [Candidatus Paceibacterota bacterium]
MKKVLYVLFALVLVFPLVSGAETSQQSSVVTTTNVVGRVDEGKKVDPAQLQKACDFKMSHALGARGEEVLRAQQLLVKEGLLSTDNATGYFGPVTRKAIESFQEAKGLEKVGFVGPQTRAKLAERCVAMGGGSVTGSNGIVVKPSFPMKPEPMVPDESKVRELSAKYNISPDKLRKPSVCVTTLKADVNSDGRVDVWDLVILSSGYDKTEAQGADMRADFDKDGKIDFDDFLTMAQDIGNMICNTAEPGTGKLTCSVTSDKSAYELGETIVVSWKSENAVYATWQRDDSGKDQLRLPGDRLPTSGSEKIRASVIGSPYVTLAVVNREGKATCTHTVTVTNENGTTNSSQVVTINKSSLRAVPDSDYVVRGKVTVKKQLLTVVVVGPEYEGATDWETIKDLDEDEEFVSVYTVNARIRGHNWSAKFNKNEDEGEYTVLIYDKDHNLVASDVLMNTYKG